MKLRGELDAAEDEVSTQYKRDTKPNGALIMFFIRRSEDDSVPE